MLELTTEAATLVREIRRKAGAKDNATMRIYSGPGRGLENLKVSFTDGAFPGDHVAESHGITISINSGLSRTLDGKRLEVANTKAGERLILRMAPAPS